MYSAKVDRLPTKFIEGGLICLRVSVSITRVADVYSKTCYIGWNIVCSSQLFFSCCFAAEGLNDFSVLLTVLHNFGRELSSIQSSSYVLPQINTCR